MSNRQFAAKSDIEKNQPRRREITIANVSCYWDTIELFSRKNSTRIISELVAVQGRRVWPEDVERGGVRQGTSLKINQPVPEALRILEKHDDEFNFSISRLHLALDFDPRPEISREWLIEWLRTHTYLRHRRQTDRMWRDDDRWYAVSYAGRKTPASRNLLFYANKVGKLDGEFSKIHLEIRAEVARTVQGAGILRLSDPLFTNPAAFAKKFITFYDTSPVVKRAIRSTINANPHRDPTDVKRRVRSIMRRAGLDEAMEFTQHFSPKRFSRLRPVFPLNIIDEMQWVRPGLVTRED